jgi:tellurite resistance protein
MSTMTLPKRSFLALAAIGWADGSLQRKEADGLVRAAKACGLGDADLAEIERATKERTALGTLDMSGLSRWEQVLTYSLASWLACLDGVQSTDERETLAKLGEGLGLDKALRIRAAAVANDIACLPEGGRPDRFDFVKLADRLRERLPQLSVKGDHA